MRRAAFGLCAAWTLILAALAVVSSNPLVVGPDQILRSDTVVVARVIDAEHQRVEVEAVLKGLVREGDKLTILNLSKAPRSASGAYWGSGGRWLLPLEHFRHDYIVTTLPKQLSPPIIYEDSRDARDQAWNVIHRQGRP
jgi:hypothetical protein